MLSIVSPAGTIRVEGLLSSTDHVAERLSAEGMERADARELRR